MHRETSLVIAHQQPRYWSFSCKEGVILCFTLTPRHRGGNCEIVIGVTCNPNPNMACYGYTSFRIHERAKTLFEYGDRAWVAWRCSTHLLVLLCLAKHGKISSLLLLCLVMCTHLCLGWIAMAAWGNVMLLWHCISVLKSSLYRSALQQFDKDQITDLTTIALDAASPAFYFMGTELKFIYLPSQNEICSLLILCSPVAECFRWKWI